MQPKWCQYLDSALEAFAIISVQNQDFSNNSSETVEKQVPWGDKVSIKTQS